jgi:hypothetical protein
MIGQYLPNNNETATVAFRQKICQLNSLLDAKNLPKFSDFPSHRIFKRMHEALNIDKK